MVLKTRYLEHIRYLNGDFETAVYELKTYFGFFRLQRTWETILHFYTYDGTTPIMSDGGIQGDSPEFMVFCLVTLHLWGRIFGSQKLKAWHTTTMAISSWNCVIKYTWMLSMKICTESADMVATSLTWWPPQDPHSWKPHFPQYIRSQRLLCWQKSCTVFQKYL